MTSISIQINWSTWITIQNHIGISKSFETSRKRFKAGFIKYLNDKIKTHTNCEIGQGHNWFRKENSQRVDSTPFWTGLYKCRGKLCDAPISLKIKDVIENADVIVEILFSKPSNHSKLRSVQQCRGKERDEQKKNIMANRTLNTLNSNIIRYAEHPEEG